MSKVKLPPGRKKGRRARRKRRRGEKAEGRRREEKERGDIIDTRGPGKTGNVWLRDHL